MFFELLFKQPETFVSTVILVVVSVIIHELAHGLVAISQGDNTPKELGHITLNPVTHLGWAGIVFLFLFGISWGQMPVDRRNFKHASWSNILVSAAGPLSNLVLSFIFIIGIVAFSYFKDFLPFNHGFAIKFMFVGAVMNLVLCFFNLLPVPPLDGFSIASEAMPPLKSLAKNPYLPLIFLLVIFNVPGFWKNIYSYAQLIVEAGVVYFISLFS
ncbi:MAG: site-2 protease family protein [Candidatus Caenarcaniphilales bacterium]|nr:site-2 protease family protein [Candidatus Caenarcaniphilales bacterium]